MAGPPPGFAGMLAQKYQIEQQRADASGNLQDAQAQQINASTPFENALKAAQASQTNATTGTIKPLADASIAKTNADIGEAGARAGYYGAETGNLAQLQSLNGPIGARLMLNTLRRNAANPTTTPATPPFTPTGEQPVMPPMNYFAAGTDDVQVDTLGQGMNSQSYISDAARNRTGVQPGSGFDPPASNGFGSGHPLEGFLTHLFGSPSQQGSMNPGQSMISVDPATAGPASTDGRIGLAQPPGYAKGTSRVPSKGRSSGGSRAPMPSGPAMPAPAMAAPPPGMVPGGAPSPVGGTPVQPAPNLASMLMAAMGANRVPGQGTGKVDTVPAMLAPGEAVLNKHAAETIGRARIAAANAKGARKMGLHKGMPLPPARAVPHFASGTVEVPPAPAPGQTITNGSWDPTTLAPPTSMPTLGQNTGLRLQLGMGKPRV